MNILCLGCSFTSNWPVFSNNSCWPKELAVIMPEHNIINIGHAGSSIAHSVLFMEKFLASKIIKIDKIIFQITTPGRITYYNDLNDSLNFNKHLHHEGNYISLKLKDLQVVTYGLLNEKGTDTSEFAKIYYSKLSQEHFLIEHKVYVDYVLSKADIVFSHLPYDNVLSIKNVLGEEKFNNYIVDDGYHFSQEGIAWQASFIKQLISS